MKTSLSLEFDIESIVKVQCNNTSCIYHLDREGYNCCKLKYIEISNEGECNQATSQE